MLINRSLITASILVVALQSLTFAREFEDSKLALEKFEKIVSALNANKTILPKNKKSNKYAGLKIDVVTNTESTAYDVVPNSSLVNKFTGKYIIKAKDTFFDSDTNLPSDQYLEVSELLFRFDNSSKNWEYVSISITRIALNDSLVWKKGEVTSKGIYEGIEKLQPAFRQALISCIEKSH